MSRGRLRILLFSLGLVSCHQPSALRDSIQISAPYELESLDPHLRNYAGAFAILSHFYEPLVSTDPTMALRPALAQKWSNPDARTWVFELQKGVLFHSGKPLTAEDAVFSIERLRRGGLEMADYVADIESVRAIGPLTIEIRTRRATGLLLSGLRFVLIVPRGAQASSMAAAVDGTGPYRLVSFHRDREIEMVRNDRYWGPAPAMRKVRFRLARSPDEALQDLRKGASQLIQCNSKSIEQAVQSTPHVSIRRRSSIFVKYLSFDFGKDPAPRASAPSSPFANLLVRQALNLAIDRPQLVAQLSTYAVPASQPVPPFVFGHNPAIPVATYQPEAARELLRKAGYPKGFSATLIARKIVAETAERLREMLAKVGITLSVQVQGETEFFEAASRRQHAFFLSRFGCPTGDADTLLSQLVRSERPGLIRGSPVFSGNGDPALDELIDREEELLVMEERRHLMEEIMAKVMSDLLLIPLYIDEDVYAVDDAYTWQPRNDSYILATEIGPTPRG